MLHTTQTEKKRGREEGMGGKERGESCVKQNALIHSTERAEVGFSDTYFNNQLPQQLHGIIEQLLFVWVITKTALQPSTRQCEL